MMMKKMMMKMKMMTNNKKNAIDIDKYKKGSHVDGRNDSMPNQSKLINGGKRRVNFINTKSGNVLDNDNINVNDNHTFNGVDDDDHDDEEEEEDGYIDRDDSNGDEKCDIVDDSYDSLIMNPDVFGMSFKECSKFAHDVGLVPYLYKEMQFYG